MYCRTYKYVFHWVLSLSKITEMYAIHILTTKKAKCNSLESLDLSKLWMRKIRMRIVIQLFRHNSYCLFWRHNSYYTFSRHNHYAIRHSSTRLELIHQPECSDCNYYDSNLLNKSRKIHYYNHILSSDAINWKH